ncbi:hypothetical protein Glove_142g20 [Diversispora epigaea]|uniref:Uncharacterized protein n=1 Tax=Diversispora epigaea TaxID=1348612 RepID=A0A397IX80_9GLOM|nr:hypothetical protein Glove_142g20 [Diversispora epigaea]
MVPAETCWNSHYFCFNSLVRSKQALCNLAIRNEHPQISESNELYLNLDLCEILLNNDWWEAIECLRDILLPDCSILNKFQCDKARPFEVLHVLGYFVHFWKQYPDQDLAWFKKKPLQLLLEFENFRQKVEPFNNKTFKQFGDDIFKFWRYALRNFNKRKFVQIFTS